MKLYFMMVWALLPCAAFAAEEPAAAAPQGKPLPTLVKPAPVMINGKKFFPLNNVRRFTASGPSALQVMHHPRSPVTIVSNHSTLSPMGANANDAGVKIVTGAPASNPDMLQPAPPSGQISHGPVKSTDVLSVFTPEEPAPAR